MSPWLIFLAVIRAIPDTIKLVRAIADVIAALPKAQQVEKKAELKAMLKSHTSGEENSLAVKLQKFCSDVCQD